MDIVSSKDGTKIAYDKLGSGPSLVLVSGASCDRMVDAELANGLAEIATVYNYDRRGRGDSTDTQPYAVEREIEDLEAVISQARGPVAVLGLSSGAALAARAAAAGAPIDKLVLWEPPYQQDDQALQQARTYVDNLTVALAENDRGKAVELFMRQVGLPDEMIAGIKQSPYWEQGKGLAHTLAYDAQCTGDGTVPVDTFATITTKTLVLAGGKSFPWMHQSVAVVAEAIPNATTATLDGQDHNVHAAALNPVLKEFLAS